MNAPTTPIGEDDLQAYVDGKLPGRRRDLVETFLRENPAVAERVASYRRQRDELAAHLRARAEEPIPARLRVATIAAHRARRHRVLAVRVASAGLIFALGAGAGWLAGQAGGQAPQLASSTSDPVAELAVSAHRLFTADSTHPVEVAGPDGGQLADWISARLSHDLPVPDLTKEGFRLMGGRVLPGGISPAAQVMYEDAQGRRLTIYIKTGESGESRPRFIGAAGMPAILWRDDGCGYVIAAEFERERLERISDAVFGQMEDEDGSKS